MRSGRRENTLHTGARVRRATNHLKRAISGFDGTDLQPIGVRMSARLDNTRHREGRKGGRLIDDFLDLETKRGQSCRQLLRRCLAL